MKRTLALALALVLTGTIGCSKDDDAPATGENGEITWATGQFNVTATHVEDSCFDGAAELIALGAGNTERDFDTPLQFLGSDQIPGDVTIRLIEPFGESTGSKLVRNDAGLLSWDPPATRKDVDLGGLDEKKTYDGCIADFTIKYAGEPKSVAGVVEFVGKMTFTVDKMNDNENCPVVAEGKALPCSVEVDMTARQAQ